MNIGERTACKRTLMAALVAGGLLAGVLSQAAAETVTITYMTRWTSGARPAIIAEFEKAYPNIKVQMLEVPGGNSAEIMEKFAVASAGRVAPDVVALGKDQLYPASAQGLLLNLDPLSKKEGYDLGAQYLPGALSLVSYKGGIWGLPVTQDTLLLMYNRRHFEEAGMDPNEPPATWSAFTRIVRKLTQRRSDGKYEQLGYRHQTGFLPYLWNFGGQPVSEDGLRATVDTAGARAALEFLASLGQEFGAEPEYASDPRGDAFKVELASMTIHGSWEVEKIAKGEDYTHPDFDLGIAPIPTNAGRSYTTGGGTFLSIASGSKHPKEAWAFVTFFASREMSRLFGGGTALPVRFDVARDLAGNPAYTDPKFRRFIPGLIDILSYQVHLKHPASQRIQSILNQWAETALTLEVPAAEAQARMQREVQAAIDEVAGSIR